MEKYLKESAITLPVSQDWFGDPVESDFRFILQVKEDSILFGAHFPENCFALGESGKFVEGLWDGSVVELFIHSTNTPSYVELNLSPTGAYWAAQFSDYRVRQKSLELPVTVESKHLDGKFAAVLKLDRSSLPENDFTVAQTAILDLGNIKAQKRIYLTRKYSWSGSAKNEVCAEPDFHQKKLAEVL